MSGSAGRCSPHRRDAQSQKEKQVLSGSTISEFVAEYYFYAFLAIIVMTVMGRRYGAAFRKKRVAVLIQAVSIFVLGSVAGLIAQYEGSDIYFVLALVVVAIVLAFPLRSRAFPYRRTCPSCGEQLDYKIIMFRDDHLCEKCQPAEEEA